MKGGEHKPNPKEPLLASRVTDQILLTGLAQFNTYTVTTAPPHHPTALLELHHLHHTTLPAAPPPRKPQP